MPKLIDHDRRQEEITEMIWRVIHAQGISGVSIRAAAAEAGISTGSPRHVFPNKADLLVHAMELVGRRAQGRVEKRLYEPDPRTLVLAVIKELLPLDAEQWAEMEVNVALIAEAPGDGRIKEVLDVTHATVRDACRHMIAHLHRAGLATPGLDVEGATTLLHGLVNKLAIHVLVNPDPAFERQALSMTKTAISGLWPTRLRSIQRRSCSSRSDMRRWVLRNRDSSSRVLWACRESGNEAQ